MSRRHKAKKNTLTQNLTDPNRCGSLFNNFNINCDCLRELICEKIKNLPENQLSALQMIVKVAFDNGMAEIDDTFLKIRLSTIKECFPTLNLKMRVVEDCKKKKKKKKVEEEENPSKRGRPLLTRLMKKIADSEVVTYFKKTKNAVLEKCEELYHNLAQYCICFLKGIFLAFSPEEDCYGKISHFHEILEDEIPKLPTRRTLSNYCNWFDNWKSVNKLKYEETQKDINERIKHQLWEQLIEWIREYLQKLAPQYAIVNI